MNVVQSTCQRLVLNIANVQSMTIMGTGMNYYIQVAVSSGTLYGLKSVFASCPVVETYRPPSQAIWPVSGLMSGGG